MKMEEIVDSQEKTRKLRNAIKHKKVPSVVNTLSKDRSATDKHYSGNRQHGMGDYNDEGEHDGSDPDNVIGEV